MKPGTASALLAVIDTASKHLHNDLARAIKALEQKKLSFHCRFTLIFSHARHIDTIDVHWCLSYLHGLALRSPGSWLGGSRVSASRFLCLAPWGSSCDIDGFSLVFTIDDVLRTGHTSCLVIRFKWSSMVQPRKNMKYHVFSQSRY